MKKFDVMIIGGGVSGAIAGIAAARNGANTLIVEQSAFLGGALTLCGVGPMYSFHAGKKQVIKGITDELVMRLKAKGKSPGHVRDSNHFCYTLTPFNAEAMKLELDLMLEEAKATVLFHSMLAGAKCANGRIESIRLCNKAGISDLYANVFVDATGDADLANFCGVPFNKGRSKDGNALPMTLNMHYCNVDFEQTRRHILNGDPKKYWKYYPEIEVMQQTPYPVFYGFTDEFAKAKSRDEIHIPRDNVLIFATDTPGEVIVNSTRVMNEDGTDPWSLSRAEMIGRKQAAELDPFLRKYIPGFQKAILEYTGPYIGVRSSRQIKGIYTYTLDDVINCHSFPDTIAHSGYPVDIHNPTDGGTTEMRLKSETSYYSLPYRIMINSKIENLIVTGRCVSAEFEAQAAIRTTPTVGALGQASGVAAALASAKDGDVTKVDVSGLRTILKEQGAFLDD